jgi:hypothetical protein
MKYSGRFISILFLTTLLFWGCKAYRQETLRPGGFFILPQVQEGVSNYDLYFHDGRNSYKMESSAISRDTLQGSLRKVDPAGIVTRPRGRKEVAKHTKEINIYLKSPVDTSSLNKTFKFTRDDISKVDVFAKNKRRVFGIITGILLILGLGALLVYGLVVLALKGSDESSNQSSGNSNSNSNSGNSSDNSSGGSGCYVATMVYGSYDAPQVMVLRRFRDNFLAEYAWGRSFIQWYYAHSPAFVERYRNSTVINSVIRFLLNGFVKLLSIKW